LYPADIYLDQISDLIPFLIIDSLGARTGDRIAR
jgi:hypothetical protein